MFLKINKVFLNNFISHPKTEIYFDYGVTAIIGENGSGKTSIIDAIIVAFGGKEELKIRGVSRNLIRRRASEARIAVEFSVDNRVYCVERIISKLRTDYTRVLYELVDGKKRVIARGDKVVEELEKILGLKPSTINTIAILRQGRLYELISLFTSSKKKAKQELIDELLGLDKYRKAYENMAKLLRIDLVLPNGGKACFSPNKTDVPNLRSLIETNYRRKKELEEEIDKYEKELSMIDRRIDELSKQLREIREQLDVFQKKYEEISNEIRKYEIVKNEYDRLKKEVMDLERRLSELEKSYRDLSGKIRSYSKYRDLAEVVAELESKRLVLESRKKDYVRLRRDLELLRERVALEKQDILSKISRYRMVIEKIKELSWRKSSLEDQVNSLRKRLESKELEITSLSREVERIVEDIGTETYDVVKKKWSETSRELDTVSTQIEEYMNRLSELEKAGAKCPICGRELTHDHKMRLINQIKEKLRILDRRRRELENKQQELDRKLESLRDLEKELAVRRSRLDKVKAERESIRKELVDGQIKLEHVVKELSSLEEELRSLKELDIESIEKRYNELLVETKDYKPEDISVLENELVKLENEISDLESAVENSINALMREMGISKEEIIHNFNNIKNTVTERKMMYEKYSRELSRIEGELSATRSSIDGRKQRLLSLEELLKKYDPQKLYSELESIKERIVELRDREKSISSELIEWSMRRGSVKERLVKEKDELKRIREFLDKAVDAYRVLVLAYYLRENVFNYERAPAEIRKQAIRFLEKETGRILEQFELDYTAISFTSDLGIEVYSSRGTAYTLSELSGGEQVAVILAIILGLHKIIGKGRLGILALDEPTIYLDEERRKKLIEVIKNFRGGHIIPQLIVITHNREVVNASDQVYEVVKEPTGSRVSVLETM